MSRVNMIGIGVVVLACIAFSQWAHAGNKKLMSVEAAKTLAGRAIAESVAGLKVKSVTKVEDLVAQGDKVDAEVSALIKGIEYTDITYDSEKDIAKVTARMTVERGTNVLGQHIDYGDVTIERVAFATSTPEMAGSLKALRAAEIDAYRELARQLTGQQVVGETVVEQKLLDSDTAKSQLVAAIYGARLVDFKWDDDGNAHVRLSLKADYVRDILGQRFTNAQPEIVVTGVGAQADDFSAAQEGGVGLRRGEIKEDKLAVPVPDTPARKSTGGAAAGSSN